MTPVKRDPSTQQYLSWGHKKFINRVTYKPLNHTFIGLFVCLILFSLFASFFSIELSLESQGYAIGEQGSKTFKAVDAQVQHFHVVSGQIFKADETLLQYNKGNESLKFKAPFDGRVIKAQSLKNFDPQQDWIEIEPLQQGLLVITYIKPTEIHKMKIGAKAYIEFESASKSQHGYFTGQVVSFEYRPDQQHQPTSMPLHKITIKADDDSLKKLEFNRRISGMNAKTKIVWKKDRLINVVLDFFMGVR